MTPGREKAPKKLPFYLLEQTGSSGLDFWVQRGNFLNFWGVMSSILKKTVSSNPVARFKALLVSDPSREGEEVGGRVCPRKEKKHL